MKKICVVGPVYPYRGGIAWHTEKLVEALRSSGQTVEVFSFRNQYPKWLYPGKSDKQPGADQFLSDVYYVLDPLAPLTWLKTARQIRELQPDLVVLQWWNTFWSPCFGVLSSLLRKSRLRVAFLIHNVVPHETWRMDKILSRMVLKQATNYIVQSERELKSLRKILGNVAAINLPHPIYEIPDLCDTTQQEARQALGLPLDVPVMLFFGIVRPYKGLMYLLDAFEHLKDLQPIPHLLIVGEFWEPVEIYQQKIKQLGIENFVHIRNEYVPDSMLAVIFSAADLFVAPYVDGTQSGAIKLAMGAGLPLIVSDFMASDSISLAYPAILRIRPADSFELAVAIRRWASREWQPEGSNILSLGWNEMAQALIEMVR